MLPTLIVSKPASQKPSLRWWDMGLPLDLLTACRSQEQPLSSLLHRLSLSVALWGKHCWQKDLQIVIRLKVACCTQHIDAQCAACPPPHTHTRWQLFCWTVLVHTDTIHKDWPTRCTVTTPPCFWDIARGILHPLFNLLVSEGSM